MPNKDKSYALGVINEFVKTISTEYSVISAYLFGSYCYELNNDDSDIDMALILKNAVDNEKDFDIFQKAQRFNLDLETVVYSEEEFNRNLTDLIPEIKTNGIRVV